ncbi:Vta1 like-domain-containing protein [Bombardia bombarda]|uniref:Vta1 like-domain-containing protein n=1 Tax=Bombardia bombarda TaxID=252184 RepID=A0AA40CAI4_9PEZI|nr:Vta1 like-domain-containing protein [Bombardia bombarda]
MTDSIPASLKQADATIWKCATKAAQLQTAKPIVAYWCMSCQLHLTGEDILHYTTNLMDKLEQTKAKYADEDAILDDAAGQAYVEQFAQETLDRAERVVKANRVTQQTASTFDAAATLFHLVNIWGTPDQETQQKIKYAKWNAARIVKAIKDGKDPNESNPKQEEIQQPAALDPNDPEVQKLSGAPSSIVTPRPVTVEEVPDVDLRRDTAGVSLPHSPVSRASDSELNLPGVPTELTEPAGQPGYFDNNESMPSPVSPPLHNPINYQASPDLPPPPNATAWSQPQPSPDILPSPTWPQDSRNQPASGWAPRLDPHQQPSAPPTAPLSFSTNNPPPVSPPTDSYYTNTAPTAYSARAPVAPLPAPVVSYRNVQADEAAMASAQKHAKWAISALNFEDVPTAVKELRKALEMLGAS